MSKDAPNGKTAYQYALEQNYLSIAALIEEAIKMHDRKRIVPMSVFHIIG